MSEQFVPAKPVPTPEDFLKFVPYACSQMQAPFYIDIQRVTTEEYVSKDAKSKPKSKRPTEVTAEPSATTAPERLVESSTAPFVSVADGPAVVLTALCDPAGHVIELRFHRCEDIPTLLLRTIALCLPHHRLLTRFTARWAPPPSRIHHELALLLPQSNITELCLDDSPALERNCHLLLAQQSQLRSLSLARCDLDDEDCVQLAAYLQQPEPASRTLVALSLASNAVADAGAAALGEALRTNRTLRHLNLAGNQVTDDGAAFLLRSLARFRLRSDEVVDKRKRYLDHLKRKGAIYAKCFNELLVASGDRTPTEASGKKRPIVARVATFSSIALKAEAMTSELLGPLLEPFNAENTLRHGGDLHCVGNLTLSYLNLAYNNLQHGSLMLLLNVLQTQASLVGAGGLVRVQLDGNLLPSACAELVIASELLAQALGGGDSKQPAKRGDRTKKK